MSTKLRKFLNRRASAEYLKDKGYPISFLTLQTLACRGGGPKFHKFGRNVIYDTEHLDEYAEARLSPPLHSTSEAA